MLKKIKVQSIIQEFKFKWCLAMLYFDFLNLALVTYNNLC